MTEREPIKLIIGEIYKDDWMVGTLIAFDDKECVLRNDKDGYFVRNLAHLKHVTPKKVIDGWYGLHEKQISLRYDTIERLDFSRSTGKPLLARINIRIEIPEGEDPNTVYYELNARRIEVRS